MPSRSVSKIGFSFVLTSASHFPWHRLHERRPTSNRRELHVRPVEPGVVDSMLPGELAKSADPFGVHTASETDARHCLFSLAPPKKPLKKPLQNRSKNILVDIGFALSGTCPRIIFNVAAKCWRPLSQKRDFFKKTTKQLNYGNIKGKFQAKSKKTLKSD